METSKSTTALLSFCVLCLGFAVQPALADDDDHNKGNFRVRLSPSQETPSVSSVARGEFRLRIGRDEQPISYELSYSGLEGIVTQGHIHFGQKGVAGGISVWLCQTPTPTPPTPAFIDPTGLAPTCPQEGTVTGQLTAANVIGPAGQGIASTEFAELVKAIRAGLTYANVHSTKFGPGEIRGQIK